MFSWVLTGVALVACRKETEPVAPPPAACTDAVDVCGGPAGCTLDIDLRPHTLSGTLTYDGAPLTLVGPSDWRLRLVDARGRSTSVALPGAPTYAVPVLPGTYDVYFELLQDGAVADPVEGEALVAVGLVVDGDETLDLALQPITLNGSVSWQGSPLVATSDEDWRLYLTEPRSGVSREIPLPGGPTYATRVYPGTYDVAAELVAEAAGDPDTHGAIPLAEGREISAGDATFDVTVEFARLSGPMTMDGAPAPADGALYTFEFHDVDEDRVFYASIPGGPTWEMWVPLGTYDVEYFHTPLAEDVVVDGDGGFPVALPFPVEVSGRVSLDGAPIPTLGDDDVWSLLFLKDPTGFGDRAEFPGRSDYQTTVLTGTYDVFFALLFDAPLDPAPERIVAVATRLEITADTVLDFDVRTGTLVGTASFPDGDVRGPYEVDVELTLEHTVAPVEVAAHTGEPFELALYQGTFDVAASAYTHGLATPVDGMRSVGSVTVGDSATFEFAQQTVDVVGALAWDGVAPADDTEWRLVFTDPATGEAHGAGFSGGAYAAAMFPGLWDVSVELVDPEGFPAPITVRARTRTSTSRPVTATGTEYQFVRTLTRDLLSARCVETSPVSKGVCGRGRRSGSSSPNSSIAVRV